VSPEHPRELQARYLVNGLRQTFGLNGVPIRLSLRFGVKTRSLIRLAGRFGSRTVFVGRCEECLRRAESCPTGPPQEGPESGP
jgi:hypothetical protein